MTLDQAFEQLKTLAEDEIRKSGQKMADGLHQTVRRLRNSQNVEEITALLVNSPQEGRSVSVTFESDQARIGEAPSFPIHDAPALVSAIETKDTVVTAADAKELSEPLYLALDTEGRVHLIPVVVHGAVQIVVVVTELRESAAFETLCEAAGSRLETLSLEAAIRTKPEEPAPALIQIASAKTPLTWNDLPPAEQSLHLQAQRFAQVAVARMRVELSPAVREGQRRGDLYSSLGEPIDRAREEYKKLYLSGQSETMVDYLYVELLRSLANDEDRMLGPGFPGRLT